MFNSSLRSSSTDRKAVPGSANMLKMVKTVTRSQSSDLGCLPEVWSLNAAISHANRRASGLRLSQSFGGQYNGCGSLRSTNGCTLVHSRFAGGMTGITPVLRSRKAFFRESVDGWEVSSTITSQSLLSNIADE